MQYGAIECTGEQVQLLHSDEEARILTLKTSVAEHRARAILTAAGVGSFQPKTLPLEEAESFQGRACTTS